MMSCRRAGQGGMMGEVGRCHVTVLSLKKVSVYSLATQTSN